MFQDASTRQLLPAYACVPTCSERYQQTCGHAKHPVHSSSHQHRCSQPGCNSQLCVIICCEGVANWNRVGTFQLLSCSTVAEQLWSGSTVSLFAQVRASWQATSRIMIKFQPNKPQIQAQKGQHMLAAPCMILVKVTEHQLCAAATSPKTVGIIFCWARAFVTCPIQ